MIERNKSYIIIISVLILLIAGLVIGCSDLITGGKYE
jgi:hypothetical protein